MFETIKPYIPEILIALGGIGSWGYERNKRRQELRKAEQELKLSETENNKSIMDLYQEALNDLKKRYDSDLKELEAKYDEKFKMMEVKYNKLKKSFEDYKKLHK